MRFAAIAASVVLSLLAAESGRAAAQDPRCASADAFRGLGQTEEAIKEYVLLLKPQPSLPCAVDGLRAIARAGAERSQASTRAKCEAADELADAGERHEAKTLYVEALKAGDSCGRAGLDVLDDTRSWDERWKDRLAGWTGALGVLALPLVVALLVLALLWAVLTYIGPFRRRWRNVKFLGHPLKPRLKVGTFADSSIADPMGISVVGVLSSALTELGRDQERQRDDYRLDNATGAEGIDTAVASLGDISPQFKAIAGILSFVRQVARSPRYELNGTVQVPRDTRCGLTVSLDRTRGSASTSTLWDTQDGKNQVASRVYYLAGVAAGWADFRLRQREQLELPEGFMTAESYGHFRAGVDAQRNGDAAAARKAYREALLRDRRNVPALLNLARLEGRQHHYQHARDLLDYAIAVLEHELSA